MKLTVLIALIMLLLSSSVSAGFYSKNYDRSSSVVATVEIEGKGIYNLVVSIQFMGKPKDKKIFKTDEYAELVNRLNVEARSVALRRILASNSLKISELVTLKNSIEKEIESIIPTLKKKYNVNESVEVVYSISSFYLLEPSN